jgi:hypothetical protein
MKPHKSILTGPRLAGAALLAATLASYAATDYPTTVLSQGPVGYWRLNETTPVVPVFDLATNRGSLGPAEDGYYGGDLSNRGVPGAVAGNTAASFDGATEYVDVPYDSALNPTAFTAEGWFAPATLSPPGGLTTALACGDFGSPRAGWLVYQSTNGWNFRMYNQRGLATSLSITAVTNMTVGTFYHLVATFDGTTANVYVNGVLLASGSPSGSPAYVPGTAGDFTIAIRSDGGILWAGKADEVAFYNSVLSANTIAAHYAAASTNAAGYATQVLADHPLVYYRLDEPALPANANLGSLGSAATGVMDYPAVSGQPGPASPAFPGFTSGNVGVSFSGGPSSTNSGGEITIPALNLNTNTVTITCWVKPNGSQAGGAGLVVHRANLAAPNTGTTAGLVFDASGGLNLAYNWDGDNATYNWFSGVSLNDAAWNFVSLIIKPDSGTLFVPGGPSPDPSVLNHTHGALGFEGTTYIGTDPAQSGFNGTMDEVAIFNRALSLGEVYTQYGAALGNVAPRVFADPQAPTATLYAGDSLTLTVDAGGTPSNLSFRWRKNSLPITGATTSTFTIAPLIAGGPDTYDVVVTNDFGAQTSAGASITVAAQAKPIITADLPTPSRTLYPGGVLQLAVTAAGGGLTYQWTKNSSPILDATNAALTISPLVATNAGSYAVTVNNSAGSTPSATAAITIAAPAAGSYEAQITADGPLSWWRLDDAPGSGLMLDAMGRADGYWSNLVTLGASGALTNDANTAATFDANNQGWGEIPLLPTQGAQGDFTFECWVRPTDALTTETCPMSAFRPKYGFWFQKDSDGTWRGRDGYGDLDGNNSREALIGDVTPGQWTYLVAEFSSTDGHRVFINGRWDGNAYVDFCRDLNVPMRIGSLDPLNASGLTRWFTGDIDEVAVYGTALTPDQVLAHYLAGKYSSISKPVFAQQPQSLTVPLGSAATFAPIIEGSPVIGQQWYTNGVAVPNATSMSLTINAAGYADAIGMSYTCVATNSVGSTTSLVATLTVLPQPTYVVATNNLVLHLKFDGDYLDASGRGHDATAVGSPTISVGVVGKGALHYSTDTTNAIYNYLTLGPASATTPDFQFSTNVSFSVAYWVKLAPGELSGDLPFLCSAIGSFSNFGLDFAPSYDLGGWSWSLGDGTTFAGPYGPDNSINDGQWHHLAHTFDRANGQGITYLDGMQVDQTGFSILASIDSGNVFNIGQDPTGSYPESGSADLDDLSIWRRLLSPIEAYSMYYVGKNYGRSYDATAPIAITLTKIGSDNWIVWQGGTLWQADSVNGPWTTVPSASAPYYKITLGATNTFFRVK